MQASESSYSVLFHLGLQHIHHLVSGNKDIFSFKFTINIQHGQKEDQYFIITILNCFDYIPEGSMYVTSVVGSYSEK